MPAAWDNSTTFSGDHSGQLNGWLLHATTYQIGMGSLIANA